MCVYKQRKTPVRKSSYSPLLRCVGRLQSTQGIALHHVQVHLGSDCDDDHVKVRRDGDADADVDHVQLMMMVLTSMLIINMIMHLVPNKVSDVVDVIFDHGRPLKTQTPGDNVDVLCKMRVKFQSNPTSEPPSPKIISKIVVIC